MMLLYSDMAEVNVETETHASLTRRSLLLGLGGLGTLAALELAGCRKPNTSDLLHKDDSVILLPNLPESRPIEGTLENIDKEYLAELLKNLQERKGDNNSRIAAVRQSVRRVQTTIGDNLSTGTAFQIDESGIYLTARHVLPRVFPSGLAQEPTIIVTNPYTAKSVIAKGYIVHGLADMTVIYAPTGLSEKPAPNMQFSFKSPSDGERLWMVATFKSDTELHETIRSGRVNKSVRVAPGSLISPVDATSILAVEGLQPFGGSSGAPIINRKGVVVGIESGDYHHITDDHEYQGASITLLSYAQSLPTQPSSVT